MHGAWATSQVQLRQSQVCFREGDGVPAAARVLPQTRPLLRGQEEHQGPDGDDPLPGSLSQRVCGLNL